MKILMMSMNLIDIAILNITSAISTYNYQWNQQKRCHKLIAKCQFDRKKENIIKHENLLSHIKLGEKDLTFGDFEIEKYKFYRHKSLVSLSQVNIEKILVFNKIL